MKKILASMVAAIGVSVAAPASAIVVGGINFGVLGDNPYNVHLDTATLAQTFINGNGQDALSYGMVTTINGNSNYCADGTNNCRLYFVGNFEQSQNYDGSYVEFASSSIDIYYSSSNFNLMDQSSATNIGLIESLTLWASFEGHGNLGGGADPSAVMTGAGTLTGSTLSGNGEGLFDVVLGQGVAGVADYLDGNNIADAIGNMADIAFTSSFNNRVLNFFDDTTGCRTGQASAGQWCYQGTVDLRGDTVVIPEPSLLGLLGIGLIGLGAASRRRKA